jgi:gliding motility-associated-like protein
MKRLVLLTAFLTFFLVGHSQFCPFLGPDQYLPCGVNSTTLTADLSQCGVGSNPNQTTNYNVAQITYAPQANTGAQLFMGDDTQQGPFNIGFNFCFYGTTYTQFWVGSNGWISFSPGQSITFTSQPLPSAAPTVPKNCIMGPWQDWHPGVGGQIRYQVSGVAPCRKLTVSWIGVPMYSCTGNQGTFHIVIYESTNVIENHIQSKPPCLQWQSGTATQGIHNLPGNAAVVVPGRNSTAWTTQNNSWRWTPSGPTVVPVLTWYQVGNPAPIGTGPSINVTPPPAGANYTCQFVYPICNAGWNSCNAGTGVGPDTVFVQPGPPNLNPPQVFAVDPLCSYSCDGSIAIAPTNGTGPFTISWNGPIGLNPIGLCGGTYNYTLSDVNGCNIAGTVILNSPPPVVIGPIVGSDTVCIESSNEIYQVPSQAGLAYTWSSPGNITSGNGSNSISVDWSAFPAGLISPAVQVVASNMNGCVSNSLQFDLSILEIIPDIDEIGPFCTYDPCVSLTAIPTGGTFTVEGIQDIEFCPSSNSTGNVIYTYTQSGCSFDDTILVEVNPQPNILSLLPSDEFFELCEGDSVEIEYEALSVLGGTYTWEIEGETIISGPSVNSVWNEFGTFMISVFVTSNDGCVSPEETTSITIQECPNMLYYIPNSFTPDGDANNNMWKPVFTSGFDPYDFTMLVYNRWGQVIWESHNAEAGWDGTYAGFLCESGIYTYMIEYGNIKNDGRSTLHGHITLLR